MSNYKIVILDNVETGERYVTYEGTIGLNNEEWEAFLEEHPEYKDLERYPIEYFMDEEGNLDERLKKVGEYKNDDLNHEKTDLGNKPTQPTEFEYRRTR